MFIYSQVHEESLCIKKVVCRRPSRPKIMEKKFPTGIGKSGRDLSHDP